MEIVQLIVDFIRNSNSATFGFAFALVVIVLAFIGEFRGLFEFKISPPMRVAMVLLGLIVILFCASSLQPPALPTPVSTSTSVALVSTSVPNTFVPTQVPIATNFPPSTTVPVVATIRPQAVRVCPGITRTGVDAEMTLDLSVPDDYIQYLGGTRFDDQQEGMLVTVIGPYQGTHVLFQGAFCDPVVRGSAEDEAARRQILAEIANGGVICPQWCPTEITLPRPAG